MTFGDHLTEEEVEEFCTGRTSLLERDELEDHLSGCKECRDKVNAKDLQLGLEPYYDY